MRLFIGSFIPAAAGSELFGLAGLRPDFFRRRVKPENMHLTYAFLGERSGWEDYIPAADRAASALKGAAINISGPGKFDLRKESVFWLGTDFIGRDIKAVVSALREETCCQGEERYIPHITLGRSAPARAPFGEFSALFADFSFSCKLESLSIVRSSLTGEGALYTPLYTVQL